jgi:DNA-binding MarR family transcriptional regulator
MTKRSDAEIADEVTTTLLRVINKIQMGRRKSRRYGKAGEPSLIEAEMCHLISRNQGITGSEIARNLGVTHSATSQVISRLKARKLVREEFGQQNAKRKLLSLTSNGKEVARIAEGYSRSMRKAVFDGSRQELLAYLRFVTKLEDYHNEFLASQDASAGSDD